MASAHTLRRHSQAGNAQLFDSKALIASAGSIIFGFGILALLSNSLPWFAAPLALAATAGALGIISKQLTTGLKSETESALGAMLLLIGALSLTIGILTSDATMRGWLDATLGVRDDFYRDGLLLKQKSVKLNVARGTLALAGVWAYIWGATSLVTKPRISALHVGIGLMAFLGIGYFASGIGRLMDGPSVLGFSYWLSGLAILAMCFGAHRRSRFAWAMLVSSSIVLSLVHFFGMPTVEDGWNFNRAQGCWLDALPMACIAMLLSARDYFVD